MRTLLAIAVLFLFSGLGCQNTVVCPNKAPQIPSNLETGYLDAKRGKIFYWLVRAKQNPTTAPIVLWLNGGPGSSSLLGLFYENGPFRVTPALTLHPNPFSWNDKANVVYIEQPLGTGFSIPNDGVEVLSEADVATDMTAALEDFFNNKFPEFSNRKFYIFGESFAGSFIPWISTELLKTHPKGINLQGIAIGDGTIDRLATWEAMPEYAYQNGLIDETEKQFAQESLWPACQQQLLDYRQKSLLMFPVYCQLMENFLVRRANVANVYDYREPRQYDFSLAACYLNKPEVQTALGVNRAWVQNSNEVFWNLTNQGDAQTVCEIQNALQSIPVLIYSGNQDFLIHSLGTQKWVTDMTQGKYTECQNNRVIPMSPEEDWMVDAEIAGSVQKSSTKNLWFVKINDAGHLVPEDQPRAAKRLLEEFLGL